MATQPGHMDIKGEITSWALENLVSFGAEKMFSRKGRRPLPTLRSATMGIAEIEPIAQQVSRIMKSEELKSEHIGVPAPDQVRVLRIQLMNLSVMARVSAETYGQVIRLVRDIIRAARECDKSPQHRFLTAMNTAEGEIRILTRRLSALMEDSATSLTVDMQHRCTMCMQTLLGMIDHIVHNATAVVHAKA